MMTWLDNAEKRAREARDRGQLIFADRDALATDVLAFRQRVLDACVAAWCMGYPGSDPTERVETLLRGEMVEDFVQPFLFERDPPVSHRDRCVLAVARALGAFEDE